MHEVEIVLDAPRKLWAYKIDFTTDEDPLYDEELEKQFEKLELDEEEPQIEEYGLFGKEFALRMDGGPYTEKKDWTI